MSERELLRLALETITVERDGKRMYRTRSGVPMEMPAKFERIVRAALGIRDQRAFEYTAIPVAPDDHCDVIVNNGLGEPTECGRTLPCDYHGEPVA